MERSAFPDWGETAVPGLHLWVPASASSDSCYYQQCNKQGSRVKCTACRAICHTSCTEQFSAEMKCKITFREADPKQYREKTQMFHHWMPKKNDSGKCKHCSKAFQSKLSFSSKDMAVISCSWCKISFHNKSACFNREEMMNQECDMGDHKNIIVPPSWIVRIPKKGNLMSSLPRRNTIPEELNSVDESTGFFAVKPVPSPNMRPLLVFINPKSGGNQGVKLLQKFQWLLNPRQVFDLTKGGPKMGLELFSKVANLRVLACGGDGTVGWVLSVIDRLSFLSPPAVAVLPLGTGNDLARSLGWGGGYTDEPISKILANVAESEVSLLDRWDIKVVSNPDANPDKDGKDNLPLNVLNNYYSLGVDAHIALEFHEAREAHPEKFNSRLRNKMFYGQMGGKDLLVRKWKNLSDCVTLTCDGKDFTYKLREHKVHAIVFLNISSYGGGTHPWPRGAGQVEPSTEDGLIEVIGLTTYQLPLLQAGGHGTFISQCKTVQIVTQKTIPMQVDGEACKLKPSIIDISLLNTVPLLAKKKRGTTHSEMTVRDVKFSVHKLHFSDYENNYNNKESLISLAKHLGDIEVSPVATLELVRKVVEETFHPVKDSDKSEWWFIDSCTSERFFRIDQGQENIYYVTDIADQTIYILEPEIPVEEVNEIITEESSSAMNNLNRDAGLSDCYGTRRDESFDEVDTTSTLETNNQSMDLVNQEMYRENNREDYEIEGIDEPIQKHSPFHQMFNNFSDYNRVIGNALFCPAINTYKNLLMKNSEEIVIAAKIGDLDKLKALHSKGYSLLSIDRDGYTALHYSSINGDRDMVKYLLAKAPNKLLSMQDHKKGQSALHQAAAKGDLKIISALVAAGLPVVATDKEDNTPKDIARKYKHHTLVAYFDEIESCY